MPATTSPTERVLEALTTRACEPKHNGAGWSARCPAHDDDEPSLTLDEGTDGRALLHCHAGCTFDAILAALELRPGDLFPPDPDRRPERRIAATYDYTDENGELLFQVVRFDPKDFRQRRPDGNGGWTWKLADTRRVIYHLPQVLAGVADGQEVYVVEGEKDVHAAETAGAVATTNPGGAGKWRPEHSDPLAGAIVFVVADADAPGRTHAWAVADAIRPLAAAIDVVEPAAGKDLTDHLAAGHTLDDLRLAERPTDDDEQPPDSPPPPARPDPDAGDLHPERELRDDTDLDNARRLVEAHGAELHYVPQWGRWLHWDGRRWAEDRTGHVQRRAKHAAEAIFTEAQHHDDPDKRKRMVGWWYKSRSRARLEAMVALASTEETIPVEPHQLDADPWLLTVDNGTIDLRTGELRGHDRADLITKAAPVHYDPTARSATWDRFLETVTVGDPELAAFLRRAVGYSLTGDTREEVLFFMHGPAASGKSTFFGAIEAALGDWAAHADFETFLARQDAGGPRGDIARLAGARFVDSIEVDEGKKLAEGLIKTLTGGDTITAAFKYRDDFEFRAAFKLWLAANHAPRIRHGDEAMWRRILRVPFEHSVPKDQRDPALKAELTDPRRAGPAVLAWAVAGCLDWQHQGLAVPDTVTAATDAYRAEMDPLGEFLEEHCTLNPDLFATAANLREAYGEWSKENDVRRPLGTKAFREVLHEHGCLSTQRRIAGKVCRVWTGIGLLDTVEREVRTNVDARTTTSEKSSRGKVNTEKSSERAVRASTVVRPQNVTRGPDSGKFRSLPLEPPEESPDDHDWPGGRDPGGF